LSHKPTASGKGLGGGVSTLTGSQFGRVCSAATFAGHRTSISHAQKPSGFAKLATFSTANSDQFALNLTFCHGRQTVRETEQNQTCGKAP
jgi:hypothetical protein